MLDQPKTADDVKAICEERNVRFIRFWFTDILGQLKSFSINVAELDDAFEGGMGFDGSSITGFNAIEESDMIAMHDASTLKMADDCMTYRITVKEYAMKYGWHATFMPKPLFGENGSGMHTHQSLFKEG